MRRGTMMILALIACAMLALVLVCGVEMAGLRGAARGAAGAAAPHGAGGHPR